MAKAPLFGFGTSFGPMSGRLLVGDLGSGQIASFNSNSGDFEGMLSNSSPADHNQRLVGYRVRKWLIGRSRERVVFCARAGRLPARPLREYHVYEAIAKARGEVSCPGE
ncbi:MAG TPA: hypothetical protein VH640_10275 [Bryobacteraceae bacterium]